MKKGIFAPCRNIYVQEREASIRLRGMIGSTLSNTSQDMREQADRVAQAITDRVAETEEATRKLETNLKKTVDEIAEVETTIRRLKDAIWDKDAPNKVCAHYICIHKLVPTKRECLTNSKVGIAIYQFKGLFKACPRLK